MNTGQTDSLTATDGKATIAAQTGLKSPPGKLVAADGEPEAASFQDYLQAAVVVTELIQNLPADVHPDETEVVLAIDGELSPELQVPEVDPAYVGTGEEGDSAANLEWTATELAAPAGEGAPASEVQELATLLARSDEQGEEPSESELTPSELESAEAEQAPSSATTRDSDSASSTEAAPATQVTASDTSNQNTERTRDAGGRETLDAPAGPAALDPLAPTGPEEPAAAEDGDPQRKPTTEASPPAVRSESTPAEIRSAELPRLHASTADELLGTPAARNRFLQRVSKAFANAEQRGGGPIQIRLSPPELGRMRIELQVENGQMRALIQTETSQAQAALVDSLPALKERLQEWSIDIQQFDVDVSGQSFDSRANNEQQEEQASGGNRLDSRPQSGEEPEQAARATQLTWKRIEQGGLDVKI